MILEARCSPDAHHSRETMLKKFTVVAVAAVLMGWTGTASASPIPISSGGSYSTNFFLAAAGDPVNNLSAIVNFDIASLSSTQIVVDFKLTNTTVGIGAITAFGFSTNPNATGFAGSTIGSGDLAGDADVFLQLRHEVDPGSCFD